MSFDFLAKLPYKTSVLLRRSIGQAFLVGVKQLLQEKRFLFCHSKLHCLNIKVVVFDLNLHQLNQTFFFWRRNVYTLGTCKIPEPFNGKAHFRTVKVSRTAQVFYFSKILVVPLTDESVLVAENLVIVPLNVLHRFSNLAPEVSQANMKVFICLDTPLRFLLGQFKHFLFLYQPLQL